MGPEARWRRYAADSLYFIAAGRNVDPDSTPRFNTILLAEVYRNPFEKAKAQPYTADEIKAYIVGRLEELM